jgi:hypothetical protein
MMASKKTDSGPKVHTSKGAKKRRNTMMQFVLVGVAVVVLVVVLVLAFGGKKAVAPVKRAASRVARTTERTARASAPRDAGASRRDQVREERRRAREEARAQRRTEGRRSRRSTTGGFATTARGASSPYTLKMIVTDPGTGQRYAVVGTRRFKTGDDVSGRRIVDVGAEEVRVEYKSSTYAVKVGGSIAQ